MLDLFRDAFAGQLVRRLGGKHFLPYPEELGDYDLSACRDEKFKVPITPSRDSDTTACDQPEPTLADVEQSRRHSQLIEHRRSFRESLAQERRPTLAGKDDILVTFHGESDQLNPRNWSLRKRCLVTALVSYMTFSVYVGSAIYVPSIPGIMGAFNVGQTHATLGLSTFIIGYSVGPVFFSPLSEVPVLGRTSIYIVTLALFFACQMGVIWAPNIATLIAFRFLSGFFGSPCLATGGASITVRDCFSEAKLPYAIMIWDLGAVAGPIVGPVIGGFAAQEAGWQWPLYELAWLSGAALIALTFLLPETNEDTILLRKAYRLRKVTGNPHYVSESELQQRMLSMTQIVKSALFMPILLTFEPIVAYINLFLGLTYSVFYLWFEAFPLVFGDIYGFNLGFQGLAFMSLAVGVFVFFVAYGLYYRYVDEPRQKSMSPDDLAGLPERRYLRIPLACSIGFPISLFMFGWTARRSIPWIVPMVAAGMYAPGLEALFLGFLVYLPTTYPKYAASVLASNGLFRGLVAASFPLFGHAMYTKLTIAGGCSLLAGLSMVFIAPLIYLFLYGYKIRRRSKLATKS